MIDLDSSQNEFCHSRRDNIRLLAPAGCGKTSSLLHRCRVLSERSETRQRFLLLSFTNAAAAEMRERLIDDSEFDTIRDNVRTATLNSWGWQRLRQRHVGANLLTDRKKIYFAVKNQLNSIMERRSYSDLRDAVRRRGRNGIQPHQLMEIIDNLKSLRFDHTRHTNFNKFSDHIAHLKDVRLESLINEQFDALARRGIVEERGVGGDDRTNWRQFYSRFFAFWRDAVRRLHEELTYTFEDQKYWNFLDLVDAKPVPAPSRYHHVLVDEFQDINPLDLQLIDLITKTHAATLTIVGDDDQAIFEWRGASPEFILDPETYFDRSFITHTLAINYRSPRNIVEHSQKLISHNEHRVGKDVRSASSSAEATIQIVESSDIADEMDFVTGIVQDTRPGRVAVIARLRAQLIPYEIHFASNEVDFETATDLNLFQSRTLSDIAEILLVRDDKDRRSAVRGNVERALTICDLICRFPLNRRERQNLRRFLTSQSPATVEEAVQELENYPENVKHDHGAADVHSKAIGFLDADRLSEALRRLSEFDGMQFNPLRAHEEIFFTAPPLDQLATLVERKGWSANDLDKMIVKAGNRIHEFNTRSGDDAGDSDMNQRPLHLMTAHRSKGKEFETVIILSVLDGVWPHKNAKTQAQRESERRLFYVAFTRARQRVIMLNGSQPVSRSPFVNELELPFQRTTQGERRR